MLTIIKNQTWRSRLSWISLLALAVLLCCQKKPVLAQVTSDNTLPKNSQVTQQGNIYNITGGTQAGSNLFHSFDKFGVPSGGEAYFNNALDIQNIISRVTGKSISNINGLIRANGTANLFLINPKGIVFGENAKLDIGGSFIGSTADSIKFGDNIEFSATNPENKPLLTINLPLGLQYGSNPGKIEIKGKGEAERRTPELFGVTSGLQVPASKTLALIGGDVLLEGATLKASSGRIELGSVKEEGLVSVAPEEKGFSFGFENNQNFGEIQLSQNSAVDATGNGAGDVRVTAKNLTIIDNSVISSTQTGTEKSAGILINATESVNLNGINDTFIASGLYANNVSGDQTESTGNITINTQQLTVGNGATIRTNVWEAGDAGDINIKASNLRIESGGRVSTSTFKTGNGGNLNIEAQDVEVVGTGNNGNTLSELSAKAEKGSSGNGGNLNITTNNLLVKDKAFLSANTFSEGNGGDMTINASSQVELLAFGGGGLFVVGEDSSTGNAGNLTINTKTMRVEDGAFVSASNNGEGGAGNLKITTNDLLLKNNVRFFSGRVTEGKEVGELNIKTNNLRIEGGSSMQAGTSGKGEDFIIDAQDIKVIGTGNNGNTPSSLRVETKKNSTGDGGNLNIKTKRILIKDGAFVSTSTKGESNGGDLNIDAEDVQIIGFGGKNSDDNNRPYFSGLFAEAEKESSGDSGKLTINSKRIVVQNGGRVSASTNSKGNGGDLTVKAEDIQIIGTGNNGNNPSSLGASALYKSTGNAGEVNITTNRMVVRDGAFVAANTFGEGDGGDLNIYAEDVQIIGFGGKNPNNNNQPHPSGLFAIAQPEFPDGVKVNSVTSGKGNAGNLTINSHTLQVKDKSQVTVESLGQGNAGILTLNVRSIGLDNKALLNASTQSVDSNNEQATINIINARDLILRRGSNILTNAKGENVQGGNINIYSDIIAAVENSDISANSTDSRGGNIKIKAQGIFGTQFRPLLTLNSDITATGASEDLRGTVEIITPDVNPTNELTELPSIPISTKLAQGCYSPGYAQNKFFIIGRGGLPPKPEDKITPSAVRVDWVENSFSHRDNKVKTTTEKPKSIVEATGWILNDKGEIIFTDNPSVATANNFRQQSIQCQ